MTELEGHCFPELTLLDVKWCAERVERPPFDRYLTLPSGYEEAQSVQFRREADLTR